MTQGDRVTRMEHVNLCVADLDRSVAFYKVMFGWRVRYEDHTPGERTAHVGTDRFYIALYEKPGETKGGSGGYNHVGFTTDDLAGFVAHAEGLGIRIPDGMRASRPEGAAVYLADPDGYGIEVVEYKEGYVYA